MCLLALALLSATKHNCSQLVALLYGWLPQQIGSAVPMASCCQILVITKWLDRGLRNASVGVESHHDATTVVQGLLSTTHHSTCWRWGCGCGACPCQLFCANSACFGTQISTESYMVLLHNRLLGCITRATPCGVWRHGKGVLDCCCGVVLYELVGHIAV